MNLSQLKKASKVLIYGYGVEGRSTANFLKENIISFDIHDDNNPEFCAQKDFKNYDVVIVSAGINRETLAFSKQQTTSQTEIFFHSLTETSRKKVIGITGTKGKSTTAQLTHDMLVKAGKKVALAGNIGVGALSTLQKLPELDYVVLELSSFQLAHLDTPAHTAICTNLLDDHIDWHGNKKKYHQAKQNLWKYQNGNDVLLVPHHQKNFFPQRAISCLPLSPNQVPANTPWQANFARQNFGMVAELAERLEIQTEFTQALQELKTLPHRQETIGIFEGITFIDNAIASNPHGTLADLECFGEKIGTMIIGGKDRGQDFSPLFEYIEKEALPLQLIILDSETAHHIQDTLKNRFPSIMFHNASNMQESVSLGYTHSPKNSICLLSPAAASWDRYRDYNEKGEDFSFCAKQ